MAGGYNLQVVGDVIPDINEPSGFNCINCRRVFAVIYCTNCRKYLCQGCSTTSCQQHETTPVRITIYQRTARAYPPHALHLNKIIRGVDGCFYVVDMDNNLVKKFNDRLDVVSICGLPGRPWAVCSFQENGNYMVAITVRGEKKVVIAQTNSHFHVVHDFSTPDRCRGIAHSKGRLIVACGGNDIQAAEHLMEDKGQIVVFNMRGVVLFTMNEGLSQPFHVVVGPSGRIFICDRDHGVYVFRMEQNNFTQLDQLTNNQQSYTYTVTETPNGQIFVGSHNPNTIAKYDANGTFIGTVLSEEQIMKPLSILYDTQRLLVTNEGSDYIQVFSITEGDN